MLLTVHTPDDVSPLSLPGPGAATMQLCLLLCLALLSPQVTSLHHHHPQAARKRVRELLVATTAAPSNREFTFDLFRALVADSPNKNIIYSVILTETRESSLIPFSSHNKLIAEYS